MSQDKDETIGTIYDRLGDKTPEGRPRDLYEEADTIRFSSRPRQGETRKQWMARHPWVIGLRVIKVMDRSYAPPQCVGIALTPMCILKTGQEVTWFKLRQGLMDKFMSAVEAVGKVRQHCAERGIAMEKRF